MSESEAPDQRDLPEQPPVTKEPPVEYGSVREALQDTVEDERLARHVDRLYREDATVGDGGTAAALYHEVDTGGTVGGKSHDQKAQDHSNGLDKLDRDSAGLSITDREIARNEKEDLDLALAYRQQAIDAAAERSCNSELQTPGAASQFPSEQPTPTIGVGVTPEPILEPQPTPVSTSPPGQGV